MDEIEPPRARLIQALRAAGEAGLTRARLKKVAGADDPLFSELERSGETVNLGTARSPRYILREFDRRLDRACEAIRQRATPGRATVFHAAALRRGHAKGIGKPLIDEAIARLTAQRELLAIQAGKRVYYLHALSIAPLLANGAAAESFSPEAARSAYRDLVCEGGFTDVPIDQLARRSGAPLDALKAWLLTESRAGRAAPTRGDWSLAGAAARDAAIAVRGEPHLQIRLL